ncbi:BLUF domain-containing protein [Variovorax sp. RHLX14]|uniref:BLUF domain-containing protein n=1 Tax=Variovorax sp. RHLX14 TaxID=1259731 RepID=UPI003F452792
MLGRIIYTSTSLCQAEDIRQILERSRIHNARIDVTGALFLHKDKFLQYLEGDDASIEKVYQRILKDSRHADCKLIDRRFISVRIFSDWSMTWLPDTIGAGLLIDALLPHKRHADALGALDATSAGAFFYALSKLSQRL